MKTASSEPLPARGALVGAAHDGGRSHTAIASMTTRAGAELMATTGAVPHGFHGK